MASVVKLPIAVEVLKQVSEGRLALDREISLAASDIRPCCTLERRWARGPVSQTVMDLLTLAIVESDNTAADVLLRLVGGPAVVQRRLHTLGFRHIRIDRTEGQLLLDMAGVMDVPPSDEWTIELQRQLVAATDRTDRLPARARTISDRSARHGDAVRNRSAARSPSVAKHSARGGDPASAGPDDTNKDRVGANQSTSSERHPGRAQDRHDGDRRQRCRHHHAAGRQQGRRTSRACGLRRGRIEDPRHGTSRRRDQRRCFRIFHRPATRASCPTAPPPDQIIFLPEIKKRFQNLLAADLDRPGWPPAQAGHDVDRLRRAAARCGRWIRLQGSRSLCSGR